MRSMLVAAVLGSSCWQAAAVAPLPAKTEPDGWNPRDPWARIRIVTREDGLKISNRAGVFSQLDGEVESLVWTRDGRAYFTGLRGVDQQRCEIATSACRTIKLPPWVSYELSPDGRRILVTSNDHRLPAQVIDVATGAQQEVTAKDGAWLDNDRVVYRLESNVPPEQLMMFDLRTAKASLLGPIKAVEYASHLTPSPDGKYLAFVGMNMHPDESGATAPRYGIGVYDIAARSLAKYVDETGVVRFGSSGEPPRWSPDSRRLAFIEDDDTISTIDIPSMKVRSVVSTAWGVLGWVDSKHLAYQSVSRIDDEGVRRNGHGVIKRWCDLHVRDVDGGGRHSTDHQRCAVRVQRGARSFRPRIENARDRTESIACVGWIRSSVAHADPFPSSGMSAVRASRVSPKIVVVQTITSSLVGPPLRFPVGYGYRYVVA